MSRLQKHEFQWEDESFEKLYEKYPRCKSALGWWCSINHSDAFNISRNKYLKEFIIENPPQFKISSLCCNYAKKKVYKKCIKDGNYDLDIVGIRKSEGGLRSVMYKNCFTEHMNDCDEYRPLFWYKNCDKEDYENNYYIEHSKCYTEYGLKRTGCAGCPFGRDFENELKIIETYEPKLFKVVNNIFKESYEYTRKYREFCKTKNKELKNKK